MISDTVIFGIIVALLMLSPLIILHEFGHYFAAKLAGVKILEFGFGFPPRIFGIRTGATPYIVTPETYFDSLQGLDALTPGDTISIEYIEDDEGERHATAVFSNASDADQADGDPESVLTGKVREVQPDRIILKDMIWSLNLLPLGGFVRLMGEENPESNDSLARKSPLTRIGVMIAGVAVNAVLPFIIFSIVVVIPVEQNIGDVVVASVLPDSPAYQAGIRSGHRILQVDGTEITNFTDLQTAVTRRLGAESSWTVQRGVPNPFARPDESQVQYLDGESQTITLIPRWNPPRHQIVLEVEDPDSQMRLGVARVYDPRVGINDSVRVVADGSVEDDLLQVSLSNARRFLPDAAIGDQIDIVNPLETDGIPYNAARRWNNDLGSQTYLQEGAVGIQMQMENLRVESRAVPWTRAISEGFNRTFEILTLSRNAVVGQLSGSSNPQFQGPAAVGPVGLTQLSGEVATADIEIQSRIVVILTLAATLSVSLAVINLLPIPGLDGGRIIFVIIEIVRRGKRVSPEKESLVHLSGFLILIGLLIVISFNDIARIFRGESFF